MKITWISTQKTPYFEDELKLWLNSDIFDVYAYYIPKYELPSKKGNITMLALILEDKKYWYLSARIEHHFTAWRLSQENPGAPLYLDSRGILNYFSRDNNPIFSFKEDTVLEISEQLVNFAISNFREENI
jgi:hypothetical protein